MATNKYPEKKNNNPSDLEVKFEERDNSDWALQHFEKKWNFGLKIFVDTLVLFGTIFLILVLCVVCFMVYYVDIDEKYRIVTLVDGHFPAMVGLPACAGLSFMVIWAYTITSGNIELELRNTFKFKGASGPILFWTLVFFTLSVSLSMNW